MFVSCSFALLPASWGASTPVLTPMSRLPLPTLAFSLVGLMGAVLSPMGVGDAAAAPLGEEQDAAAPLGEEQDAAAPPGEEPGVTAPERAADAPIEADAKREVPDYDGREEGTSVGEAALWVPRVVLFPAYLASEYLVRYPLGWLATTAEREQWPARLVNFFTFQDKAAGVFPTVLVDFGLRASVGLYGYQNELLLEDHDLRAHAAYGGDDWRKLSLRNRYRLSEHQDLTLDTGYLMRPDYVFHGLGPETSHDARTRYLRRDWDATLTYGFEFWQTSSLEVYASARSMRLAGDHACCDSPSLRSGVERGWFPAPRGIGARHPLALQGGELILDSRRPRYLDSDEEATDFVAPPGTGVLFALRGLHGLRLDEPPGGGEGDAYRGWVGYGGTLGGFVDLTEQQRVLGLLLSADFVDPVERERDIVFTELASLGGDGLMPGFLDGRLRDRSAVAARAEYRWPVWVWLDGVIHYSVGNVFGERLSGFDVGKLRSSYGIGVSSNQARDSMFQVLLAFGTETFDSGAEIEAVRFTFGTTAGF